MTTSDPSDSPDRGARSNIAARMRSYQKIENHRGHPLIVYATSTRLGVNAMMASDAVREFIDQVEAIPEGEAVDVLIHSSGGDALTAWKLMSVLRERFKRVSVLVPFAAFSAATIFALGADEIVMHPFASLGPIDPQISVRTPDGKERRFAYEDLGAFLMFLGDEVGLTEQEHLTAVVDRIFTAIDPLVVGAARRASDLSAEVGARLLSMHIKDDRRAQQIARNLNKSFFAHGDAVSRSRARDLELKIASDDEVVENLIWEAYLGLESHMRLREPFDPMEIVLSDPQAAAQIRPAAPVQIPANSPPNVIAQIWNTVIQIAVQNAQMVGSVSGAEVPFAVINAVVESPRRIREHRAVGTLSPVRLPDGKIQVSMTPVSSGWRTLRPAKRSGQGA